MYTRFAIDQNQSIRETLDVEAPIHVFVAPDEQEKLLLQEKFHLEPYNLDSALDPEEVARLESNGDHTFIVWNAPSLQGQDPSEFSVCSVGIILTQRQVVFIMSTGEIPFSAREFRNVSTSIDVLLAALLHIIRQYVGHLRIIKQKSIELEKELAKSLENRYLLQMFGLGESLIYYSDALEGNGAVLTKLRNVASRLGFAEPQIEMLDDIILENRQASRQAAIHTSVLSGLMDARGNIVNNNMNVLLKNLTLINVVFLPLNLIASIGGMSEFTMMTEGIDWRISYGSFMVGTVLLGLVSWSFVRRFIDKTSANNGSKR